MSHRARNSRNPGNDSPFELTNPPPHLSFRDGINNGVFPSIFPRFVRSITTPLSTSTPMSSPKIILYTNHGCPWAHRVHIALKESGLDYKEVIIDLTVPREPWYLEVNPVCEHDWHQPASFSNSSIALTRPTLTTAWSGPQSLVQRQHYY